MRTIDGIEDLKALAGKELGVSQYKTIDQASIDAFADATGDHQFIHVDPERAKTTPFGGTIAHGLLTLSLGPVFLGEIWELTGVAFAVNYGYGKVRFPSPVPVDSKLRMRATVAEVSDVAGGVQAQITQTFELEGGAKPACVAEALIRVYGS
jgi:acyl dehydratase